MNENTPTTQLEKTLETFLVLRKERLYLGIPCSHVIEIMRPLPLVQMNNPQPCILGMSTIRGKATPVLDIFQLLGKGHYSNPNRFVSIRMSAGPLALAVSEVLHPVALDSSSFQNLPTLLDAGDTGLIERLVYTEGHLMVIMNTSRLLNSESIPTLKDNL